MLTCKPLALLATALALLLPLTAAAHNWMAPADAARRKNPVKFERQSVRRGFAAFQKNCATCHGKQGRGDGPEARFLETPPPDLLQRLQNHTAGDFFWKIETGRNAMPGFQQLLEAERIWDIINYLKSLAPEK